MVSVGLGMPDPLPGDNAAEPQLPGSEPEHIAHHS